MWQPSPLRRVDIVAMGTSAVEFMQDCYHAPMREKDHEVWTVNSGPLVFRCDKVWNMHDLSKLTTVNSKEVDYLPLYKTIDFPLITIRALEELPQSLEFPLGQLVDQFQSNYFANTVSYMVAGALLCGVEEIHLYGADFNFPGKEAYEAGRACVEYWLGIAHARGVKVFTAKTTTLMDAVYRQPGGKGAIGYGAVYGYFDGQPEMSSEGKVTGFRGAADDNAG